MMKRRLFLFLAIFGLMFTIAACTTDEEETPIEDDNDQEEVVDDDEEEMNEPMNIIETAEAAGSFGTLLTALDTAGLTSALEAEGSFTVFAPTDDAFADLLTALGIDAETLLSVENLSDVLLYHVLEGEYMAEAVIAGAPFSMQTLEGSSVTFTIRDGNAFINDAQIVTTDIETSNGVIHVIDQVILPLENIVDTARQAGGFNTLLAALDAADLTGALEAEGQFTVFAPTDDAFADLLAALDTSFMNLLSIENLSDVLLFHVLEGAYFSEAVVAGAPFSLPTLQGNEVEFTVMDGMAYINGAQIVTTDILTTNGVIHVIDEVILPLENIIDTANAAGSFSILLTALDTAGLTSALEGDGPFTVFAPTDDAFADLLAALDVTAEELLAREDLADILLYHVLSGTYYSGDVVANVPFNLDTLEGRPVFFSVDEGMAFINGVEIVTTDILTTNGMIHVIDEVILPQDNIIETAEAAGSFTTLLAALDQAGLTSVLEEEGQFTVFAPTDAAFADLLTALNIEASTLLGVDNLADILLFHVLEGEFMASDVVANAPFSLETLEGSLVDFTVVDGVAYINGAQIVTTDIETANGVIHVIDQVILPLGNIIETATAAESFSILLTALETANLTSALEAEGQFTVFAPTDEAFENLLDALDIDASTLLGINNLSDVLLYHVLEGAYYSDAVVAGAPFSLGTLQGSQVDFTVMDGMAYINGAQIITTDILTSNGVIHVIDQVILPLENIIDTADAAGSFTTLLTALDTAGLTSALEADGPFTVFAPTDDAFAALLAELDLTAEELLALPNLSDILLYHVLDGAYYSVAVVENSPFSLTTLEGSEVDFSVMDSMAYVDNAQIIITDILTTNGVIHVIDAVILPE